MACYRYLVQRPCACSHLPGFYRKGVSGAAVWCYFAGCLVVRHDLASYDARAVHVLTSNAIGKPSCRASKTCSTSKRWYCPCARVRDRSLIQSTRQTRKGKRSKAQARKLYLKVKEVYLQQVTRRKWLAGGVTDTCFLGLNLSQLPGVAEILDQWRRAVSEGIFAHKSCLSC